MGTQIEDLSGSGMKNFFSMTMGLATTTGDEDEKRLIQDGYAQVLKNVEAGKKKCDYSRTQTSRITKEPSLNMSLVDWSGFSGAAHLKQHGSGERHKSERRSSLQHTRGGGDKGSSRKGASKSPDGSNTKDMSRKSFARSLSPTGKSSPVTRNKYRSRRRQSKSNCLVPLSLDSDDIEDGEAKEQTPPSGGSKARAERRASGNSIHRSSLRSSMHGSNGKPRTQSKSRTRRPQTSAQRQSLSPSAALRARHQSVSPTGRLRRTVAAAASSTTLEVGRHATNRPRTLRSNSKGKRKKDQKQATDVDEGPLFQKASSFRW